MASVALEHITRIYRAKRADVRAVDDLSLAVEDGELLVLVGPSGCGKTTTLRLIAGLEEPTSGSIRIGDRVVDGVTPRDRDIAMVFQNYALYPHMTVRKNMAFGLKMRGTPRARIDRKVGETASMLGIDHLLDRKPAALSGGERQRVAVGRAVVRDPQVFLFDEPLSSLDAKLRAQMRTELKSLHRALQTTMLYVTHDQEEAMTMGDRIAVMERGIMRQCGTPLDIYDRPADRFVAGFIGTPSMNFVSGTIEGDAQASCFVGPIGRLALTADMADALKPSSGSAVVLGFRPEHLRLDGATTLSANGAAEHDDQTPPGRESSGSSMSEPGNHNGSAVVEDLVVDMVEHLGDSINVYLKGSFGEGEPPSEPLVARVAPTMDVSQGQRVRAFVDMSRVHVFAADSKGKRLA